MGTEPKKPRSSKNASVPVPLPEPAGPHAARLPSMPRQFYDFLRKPVRFAPGMGPKRAEAIAQLGVITMGDLLWVLPRRYEDRRSILSIAQLPLDEPVLAAGAVVHIDIRKPKSSRARVRSIIDAVVNDGTGQLHVVWFNQPALFDQLANGRKVVLYGTVERQGAKRVMKAPDVTFDAFKPTIEPIYPLVSPFTQRSLRQLIDSALTAALPLIVDPLPDAMLRHRELPGLREALKTVHHPELALLPGREEQWPEQVERARQRLAYEELFVLECMLARRRHRMARAQSPALTGALAEDSLPSRFLAALPFAVTKAQRRVIDEIAANLSARQPMNRLLQGDVGSGKTVVMIHAMLAAVQADRQAALMAPTELLAEQHMRTVQRFLGGLEVTVGMLSGSASRAEREGTLWSPAAPEADIVIGTHALFQEGVNFPRLGLVVIDEQHKFGVQQRALLQSKGDNPHVLVTSATPIPRSLALTVYGDMDVSLLDEMPPGRGKMITRWTTEAKFDAVYDWMETQFAKGRQAYLVCPVIDPSESEGFEHLHAANEVFEKLQARFAHRNVALVHGRLTSQEREAALLRFGRGETHLLVATTVIEVGIDLANATIMCVLNAERYGLAQLHQLRGRVGRGEHTSYCVLVTSPRLSADGRLRMQALVETTDGFEIAERDLAQRGPGELMGTRQSGAMLFKIADLPRDEVLLTKARRDAYRLVGEDPELMQANNMLLGAMVDQADTGLVNVR